MDVSEILLTSLLFQSSRKFAKSGKLRRRRKKISVNRKKNESDKKRNVQAKMHLKHLDSQASMDSML